VDSRQPIYTLVAYKSDTATNQITFGGCAGKCNNMTPKGDYFVENAEVKTEFQKDIFMHSRVVNDFDIRKGDDIVFNLFITDDNRPQVSYPIWLRTNPDSSINQRRGMPAPDPNSMNYSVVPTPGMNVRGAGYQNPGGNYWGPGGK